MVTVTHVTIYDIAKAAQVSPATVSRALNGSTLVRAETRARIFEIAEQMGYEPPSPTQTAAQRTKSHTIAVVISDLLNPHIVRVVKGIHSRLARHRSSMILFEHDGNREEEFSFLSSLRARGVDGLLLSTPHLESRHFMLIRQAGIPAVLFSSTTGATDIPSVGVDNAEAACQAMLHLYRLGHRSIGIIRGPMGDLTNSEERLKGCRLASLSLGVNLDTDLIKEGDFTVEGGYEAARSLLERSDPPTAIFAFSDTMAIGTVLAAKELGFNIPDALSVVGFDDIPVAALIEPSLTTVAQPAALIGQSAAEILLDSIAGKPVDETRLILPYELVERGSTGPPGAHASA